MPRALAAAVAALLLASPARADVLDVPVGARVTARAGAGVLATDDGATLLYNPANLARRGGRRVQVGLAAASRRARFTSDATFPSVTPPTAEGGAGVSLLPWAAAELALGERVVVAGATFAPSSAELAYPTAPPTFDPSRDDRAAFPHRYAGTRLELARRGGGVGAAVRVLPWLAAGVSFLAYRVDVEHERVLWVGPDPGMPLGQLSPAFDMTFAVSARDAFVPGAAAGLVIAPLELPLELGAAFVWTDSARLRGVPALTDSRGAGTASAVLSEPAARMELTFPARLRAGARVVLGRVALEVDGELALARGRAPSWATTGVAARRGETLVTIAEVPLGPAPETAWAVRAAADVEIVPRAVALVGGYAFTRRGIEADGASPLLPDADGHTVALGVEGRVAGATVTLGVSHTFRGTTSAPGATLEVVGSPGTRAATGRTDASATVVALDVEFEL